MVRVKVQGAEGSEELNFNDGASFEVDTFRGDVLVIRRQDNTVCAIVSSSEWIWARVFSDDANVKAYTPRGIDETIQEAY